MYRVIFAPLAYTSLNCGSNSCSLESSPSLFSVTKHLSVSGKYQIFGRGIGHNCSTARDNILICSSAWFIVLHDVSTHPFVNRSIARRPGMLSISFPASAGLPWRVSTIVSGRLQRKDTAWPLPYLLVTIEGDEVSG